MSAPIRRHLHPIAGLTLIELLVVTMVITILATVATPTMMAYFERAKVTRSVGAARTVQASLASAATTSEGNQYPAAISSYGDLTVLINANGGQLENTEEEMGIKFRLYTALDTVGDGTWDSYTLSFRVTNVSKNRPGWCIKVLPSGVERCPPE